MLFRPVYGPELEEIWRLIVDAPMPASRHDVYDWFVPVSAGERSPSTQNVDDALSFLVSANLIQYQRTAFVATITDKPFRLALLAQLRDIATGKTSSHHRIDSLYLLVLDRLFVQPDRLFVSDLHVEMNSIREVSEMGGLSQEKVRAWARVMSYVGLGRRIGNGFQCSVEPDLLIAIFRNWVLSSGSIQEFLEGHLVHYLPFQTSAGGLAKMIEQPLLRLAQRRVLALSSRQDSSAKSYAGEQRLRYIAPGTIHA